MYFRRGADQPAVLLRCYWGPASAVCIVGLVFLVTVHHRFPTCFRSGELAALSHTVISRSANELLVLLQKEISICYRMALIFFSSRTWTCPLWDGLLFIWSYCSQLCVMTWPAHSTRAARDWSADPGHAGQHLKSGIYRPSDMTVNQHETTHSCFGVEVRGDSHEAGMSKRKHECLLWCCGLNIFSPFWI